MGSTNDQDDSGPGATHEAALAAPAKSNEKRTNQFFVSREMEKQGARDLTNVVLMRARNALNTFDRRRAPWPQRMIVQHLVFALQLFCTRQSYNECTRRLRRSVHLARSEWQIKKVDTASFRVGFAANNNLRVACANDRLIRVAK